MFEFWVVATRPIVNNGLGLSFSAAKRRIQKAERVFNFLPDNALIYREWLRIVEQYRVTGTLAHDARMVAAAKIHQISHLLTFNVADFRRYDPAEVFVAEPRALLKLLGQ